MLTFTLAWVCVCLGGLVQPDRIDDVDDAAALGWSEEVAVQHEVVWALGHKVHTLTPTVAINATRCVWPRCEGWWVCTELW